MPDLITITRKQFWTIKIILFVLLLLAFVYSAHLWGEHVRRATREKMLQESVTFQYQFNNIPYCWVYGEIRPVEYAGRGNWRVMKKSPPPAKGE
jgi:hypothetical protein